jgi:hypothetical protein
MSMSANWSPNSRRNVGGRKREARRVGKIAGGVTDGAAEDFA